MPDSNSIEAVQKELAALVSPIAETMQKAGIQRLELSLPSGEPIEKVRYRAQVSMKDGQRVVESPPRNSVPSDVGASLKTAAKERTSLRFQVRAMQPPATHTLALAPVDSLESNESRYALAVHQPEYMTTDVNYGDEIIIHSDGEMDHVPVDLKRVRRKGIEALEDALDAQYREEGGV